MDKNDYVRMYPTWGDLAREQVRRRGFLCPADAQADLLRKLEQSAPETRKFFALACAERLMRRHEALPEAEQQPFTLGWRPVLNVMWAGLEEKEDAASRYVREALEAFRATPYNHSDGQDGPSEADEDAAAASIYAAECFLDANAKSAYWVAERAIETAYRIASEALQLDGNDFVWDPNAEPMPFAQETMHPAVQEELDWQIGAIEMLQNNGVAAGILHRLRVG